jgi:hypothetical protein
LGFLPMIAEVLAGRCCCIARLGTLIH